MSHVTSASDGRRREKPVLSCTFCRARKLRCDRESPCGTCRQKGRAAGCTYGTPQQERENAVDYRPHRGRSGARQRFARLENLVLEMRDRDLARASTQATDAGVLPALDQRDGRTVSPRPADLTDDMGKLSITDDGAVYTGSSHWVTILEDIRRLKDELSSDNDEYSSISASNVATPTDAGSLQSARSIRPSLLGYAGYLSKEELLSMLPPRKVVDRQVSHFFTAFDMGSFFIHRKTFLAEYAAFWNNPSACKIMWLGLLFSVLGLSVLLQQKDVAAPASFSAELHDWRETYRTATIHCLVAGDYVNQSRYSVETLALHFALDHNYNIDASIDNWLLLGVVIRIAMRMGLHRDPSHWPTLGPLQAEHRRRMWVTLYQMDFFTSTQVGLPRIIKDSQCDTRLPRHLFEQDLGEEHDHLPQERPSDEPSALLFIIERHPVIRLAAEIYDITEAGPPSPAAVDALDAKIQLAVETMPAWLRYKSPEASIAEKPITILQQIFMDILVNKASYLLHRRSFVKGALDHGTTRSTKICVDAALAILSHERRMSEETQPGGLMFSLRWKVSASLNHELLQATMILCFALGRSANGAADERETLPRRDDIVEALEHARSHWEEIADHSVDARRAAQAIATVLRRGPGHPSAETVAPAAAHMFLDPMVAMAQTNSFSTFDFGQSLDDASFDPWFLAAANDMPTFENTLGGFLGNQSNI